MKIGSRTSRPIQLWSRLWNEAKMERLKINWNEAEKVNCNGQRKDNFM
jgi:hypothetical protein